jgi:hypothetical protein
MWVWRPGFFDDDFANSGDAVDDGFTEPCLETPKSPARPNVTIRALTKMCREGPAGISLGPWFEGVIMVE